MKASIKHLILANPSGLLEIKKPLSIPEYMDNYGFRLQKTTTIFESKRSHISSDDWFAFGKKTLDQLFTVREESEGDLLVVFIIETIKAGCVYCHLVLSDEAYKEILNDKSQHLLKVHQMYTQFLPFCSDHIALNMAN